MKIQIHIVNSIIILRSHVVTPFSFIQPELLLHHDALKPTTTIQRRSTGAGVAGGEETKRRTSTNLYSNTIDQEYEDSATKQQNQPSQHHEEEQQHQQYQYDHHENPSFHHQVPLTESIYTQILSTNSIAPIAESLRQSYDEHFQDPRQPNSQRFAWDPWFVKVGDGLSSSSSETNGASSSSSSSSTSSSTSSTTATTRTGADTDKWGRDQYNNNDNLEGEIKAANSQIQYSLKRIQSSSFFTKQDQFSDLIDQLTFLGRSIGCTAITPPWMSLYTNGDTQNFHTDAPQGQMAFVLSLCREGDFAGGETMMLRSEILDYWKGFDGMKGLECGNIVRFIPPTPLGRCIIFDPRVPHGVTPVIGNQDPRNGRVVIHGWFNEPETCYFGPWGGGSNGNVEDLDIDDQSEIPTIQRANKILEDSFPSLLQTIGGGEIGRVTGYLAIRLEVDDGGEVSEVLAVCDTLKADWDDYRGIIGFDEAERPIMEDAINDVRLTIYEAMKSLHFDEGEHGRAVVIPFAFQ